MFNRRDVLKYLNSKDIADYIEKVEYEPSFAAAIWIVFFSRKLSLWEKIEKFRDIEKTAERTDYDLVETLELWLDKINKELYDFNSIGDSHDVVYSVSLIKSRQAIYFRTLDECMKYMNKDGKISYEVTKIFLDDFRYNIIDSQRQISAIFRNYDGKYEIRSIVPNNYLRTLMQSEDFREVQMDVPVPFKKGDVLKNIKDTSLIIFEGVEEDDLGNKRFLYKDVGDEEDFITSITYRAIFDYQYAKVEEE